MPIGRTVYAGYQYPDHRSHPNPSVAVMQTACKNALKHSLRRYNRSMNFPMDLGMIYRRSRPSASGLDPEAVHDTYRLQAWKELRAHGRRGENGSRSTAGLKKISVSIIAEISFRLRLCQTLTVGSLTMQRTPTYRHAQYGQPVPRGASRSQIIGSCIAIPLIIGAIAAPMFTAGVAVGAVIAVAVQRIDIPAPVPEQGSG